MRAKRMIQAILCLLLAVMSFSGLKVHAEEDFELWPVGSNVVKADENGTAILEVEIWNGDTNTVSLQWYEEKLVDGNQEDVPIEGATGLALYVTDVTEERQFVCEGKHITTGNTDTLTFYVYPYSVFNVSVEGDTDITVQPGGSASFHIIAESQYDVDYTWYKETAEPKEFGMDYGEANTDITSGTLVLENVMESQSYNVYVSDWHGGNERLHLSVTAENHLDVNPGGTVYGEPDEPVTLHADVTADNMTGMEYYWYRIDPNGRYYSLIEGASGADYTTDPSDPATEFIVFVRDAYKNWGNQYFDIVQEGNIEVSPRVATTLYPEKGEDVELGVDVRGEDLSRVTYTWYLLWTQSRGEINEEIEGADTDTYIYPNFQEPVRIECDVYDGYSTTHAITFYLAMDNDFYVYADEYTITVPYGGSGQLHVITNGNDLSHVTYEWREYTLKDDFSAGMIMMGESVDDAETDTLVLNNITEARGYEVDVYDGYGGHDYVWFNVNVENHLTVNTERQVYADQGQPAELHADVSADDMEGMRYIWCRTGMYGSDVRQIEGADGPDYTTEPVTSMQNYIFYAVDKYKNYDYANITVSVDNDFDVEPRTETDLYPEIGENVELGVTVTGKDLSMVTYEWYIYWTQSQGMIDEQIEGADSDTYIFENFREPVNIECRVYDGYGYAYTVMFYLRIDNDFRAYAEDAYLSVRYGDPVSLHVITEGKDLSKVTYSWDTDFAHSDCTSDTLVIDSVTESLDYVCTVEDGYGSTYYVYFTVIVENHFYAWADQSRITAEPGESVTMKVLTEGDDLDGVTYQWQKEVGDWEYEPVPGAADAEYTVVYTEPARYQCLVSDRFGNEYSVSFELIQENHFKVLTEGDEFYVDPGSDLTLNIEVSGDDLSKVNYRWEKMTLSPYMRTVIQDGPESSCTIQSITQFTVISCSVTDGYGSQVNIGFVARLKPSFEAVAEQEEFIISPGQEVTLNVLVSSDTIDLSDLTYSWNMWTVDDGLYTDVPLDEDGPSLTRAYDWSAEVHCTVTEPSGAYVTVSFIVEIENHFTAVPAVNPVRVKKGGTAQLKVDVHADDMGNMDFWWYGQEGPVFDSTTDTLELTNVQNDMVIECQVMDKYGTIRTVVFNVEVYEGSEITVSPAEAEIAVGETIPLHAQSETAVTWSSSDTSVAKVNRNGVVTGKAVGMAVITATNTDGESAQCTITVYARPTSVQLDQTNAEIKKGDTLQLTATVLPENARDKSVRWTSSDNSVARVEQNGLVIGLKSGTAVITVRTNQGGYTATCTVKVVTPAESVSLNKTSLALKKGESETLTATVLPEEADDKTVTWFSSDESAASVGADGKVTALKSGTAVITAKTNDGGYTAECTVTVTTPVTGVSLNRTTLTLMEGNSETLTASVAPEDADDQTVTWSSSDESVASVDANGKVTAVHAGTATITVTTTDGSFTAECTVTVKEAGSTVLVTGVELDKEEITLRVGKSETLTATVLPEDAEDKSVTWSSSDEAVAKVDQSGKVTAVADTGIAQPAEAVITVTTNDGGYTAQCIVKVEDPINAFVRRLYKLCFNRNADAGGFRQWSEGLRSGKNTAAKTVQFFFTSKEYQNLHLTNDAFVEMCYQVMMGRASDAGGKKNWLDKLDAGVSDLYVLRGFVGSREFKNICADYGITVGEITLTEARDQNLGITQFVSRCYSEVLGRKADKGGLNNWCSKILNASNKKQAAIDMASNGFFHSTEFKNKNTTNDQYVTILYKTFFGRNPDTGGYNNWMNKLNSGTSRDTVLMGFANSKEFANIMAKYGIK